MRLGELYRKGIELGMEGDPRPRDEIERELREQRECLEKMDAEDRDLFDEERVWNPYHDSRLLFGDPDIEVSSLMWGIDIDTAEVLLADRLRERGTAIDVLVGHHPIGRARPIFPEVMHVQERMYQEFGVPINVAEGLLAPRIAEVGRGVMPGNHQKVVDAARHLGIPIMNLHSPCDNLVQAYLQELFDEEQPPKVSDIMDLLKGIPEYREASRMNNPPKVFVGKPDNRCGVVMVKMTGGTSGPKESYEKLAQAGVGTFVCMHLPENHIEEAKKHHVNVVIAGHMASDSLGINLVADRFEDDGVEVLPCSGLIRVKRD